MGSGENLNVVLEESSAAAGGVRPAVGRSLPRKEDLRLLTGASEFVDDLNRPGAVRACVLRSPHAHAKVVSIDTGPARAAKRADYFAAGTQVVWDVDTREERVFCYRAADPLTPVEFRRGDTADAEPALPGWRLKVDDIFA